MRYLFVAMVAMVAVAAVPTRAQVAAPALTPVGHARISAVYDVAAHDRYLYALERGVLRVLDARDPAGIHEVGSVAFDQGRSRQALRFPYLYLAGFNQPLGIVNIADRSRPEWVGEATGFPRTANDGLELAGDYLFVMRNGERTAAGSLLTLDALDLAADPARPRRVGTLDLGVRVHGEYGGMAHASGRIFVVVRRPADAAPRSLLLVIDARDPAAPRIERTCLLPEGKFYKDVDVRGDRVYLLQSESAPGSPVGLAVYQLPETGDPTLLGEAVTSELGLPIDLILAGDVVYGSFKSGGMLATFDVSDPRKPTLSSIYRDPDSWAAGLGMALHGGRLYVAGDNNPTPIFDVSEARAPRLIGRYEFEGGSASDVFVHGKRAVVQSASNLLLYDVENPAAPRRVGHFKGIQSTDPKDYPFRVVMAGYGSRAFVSYDTRPSQLVYLRNPEHPRVLSTYQPRGVVHAAVLTGTHVVLGYGEAAPANARGGIEIVAVRNSGTVRAVARLDLERPVTTLALRNQRLLAAHPDGELLIIDLHDWERPKVVGRFAAPAPGTGAQVALSDDGATGYLTHVDPAASAQGILTVIDLKSAGRPQAVGRLAIPVSGSTSMPIAVQGTTIVLVAGNTGGVAVVDVRQPPHPVIVSIQALPGGYAERLALHGRYVFVVADEDGLLIYRR